MRKCQNCNNCLAASLEKAATEFSTELQRLCRLSGAALDTNYGRTAFLKIRTAVRELLSLHEDYEDHTTNIYRHTDKYLRSCLEAVEALEAGWSLGHVAIRESLVSTHYDALVCIRARFRLALKRWCISAKFATPEVPVPALDD